MADQETKAEDGLDNNPFQALISMHDEKAMRPSEKRIAFRQNPQGVIIPGRESDCRITRDGELVYKAGSRVRLEESLALKFARSLALPVPEVHRIVADDGGVNIAMDFVDGECLEEAWPTMNPEQKSNIAEQIRDIVETMREARSGKAEIGAFGGPVRDCRRISDYTGGPYQSEKAFNEDFVLDLLRGTPPLIRDALAEALRTDSRIVFTHGDLTPRNIIVKGFRVQALLDWEYAGWYPEYWEYVKFFDRPTDCKDWKDYAHVVFQTKYPKDLLAYQALARWQRP